MVKMWKPLRICTGMKTMTAVKICSSNASTSGIHKPCLIAIYKMFHLHHEKFTSIFFLDWTFHQGKWWMESPQVSGSSLITFHVLFACDCAISCFLNKCDKKAWQLNSVTSLPTMPKECLMAQHGQRLHGNSTQINWFDLALQLNTAIITLNCWWHLNHSIFSSFISKLVNQEVLGVMWND